MAFLKGCIQGCFDGFGRMDHAIETQTPLAQSLAQPLAIPPSSQDLSPRPPFLQGKGERVAFLKVCIQGCFDGFGRMDHAIETQPSLAQSLAQPLAIPPSS